MKDNLNLCAEDVLAAIVGPNLRLRDRRALMCTSSEWRWVNTHRYSLLLDAAEAIQVVFRNSRCKRDVRRRRLACSLIGKIIRISFVRVPGRSFSGKVELPHYVSPLVGLRIVGKGEGAEYLDFDLYERGWMLVDDLP